MFQNYFKTAFRSLFANKIYSAINIAGLGVGIAVCLITFVFLQYQQSFDNFHHNKARIFRVMTKGKIADKPVELSSAIPFPVPAALQNDLPNWTTAGIFAVENLQIELKDGAGQTEKKFKEKNGVFLLDPSFFTIFDFVWVAGNPATALLDPRSAVLTKATAEKYFGDWRIAMGKSITVENRDARLITGILADPPLNTDFQIKLVFPYRHASFYKSTDWWSINGDHGAYVMLPPNVSMAAADRQLDQLSKKYRTADNKNTQALQSLDEVHFDAVAGNYSGKTITPEKIRTIWLIAGFIILIACVNFVNLATAQSVNRAREVGVRKVLGSNRRQLTLQFLLEALLLVLSGVVLAIVLTVLLLIPVSRVLEFPFSLVMFRQMPVMAFLGLITLSVTLLAGFYPAWVLSSYNPVQALKSKLAARSNGGITLRRGLVVLQFVIAQALIIGTMLILRQINYFSQAPMGFSKSAIVTVTFPGDSAGLSKLSFLRNQLTAEKGIEDISFNNTSPADDDNWWTGFNFNHATKDIDFAAIDKFVDAHYLNTYSLPLAAGRNITTTDSIREFLVNETLAKKLGFSHPQDILNKEINLWNGVAKGPVVGVVRDFHSTSLKDSLAPVFMTSVQRQFNAAGIKIRGADLASTMGAIEKIWSRTFPDYVFEYQFLDEKIASFYKEEAKLSTFYKIFASIAIFLSCLGLYGLASFMAVQRIKEVGIRKILGATVANIVYLFSREFMVLIGIAFLIAAPVTWFLVHQWLQQYVFRIPISLGIFALGGMLAVVIALATVGLQAFKAAIVSPMKNLRSE